MHQDHGNNEATCLTAIQHGFTSVMMDGSLEADAKTPASYDYNVAITERVADMAHWVGASVEGELGVLGSLESGHGEAEDGHGAEGALSHDQLLTDPDQAVDFVAAYQGRRAGDRHAAPRTAPTSSRASPTATSSPCTSSRRSTQSCRTRISSCTARPRCRRSCRTSSTQSAARCRRPGACRSRRSCAASATACARSTSTPIAAWRWPASSAASRRRTRREFDPRKFLKPAMDAMRDLCRDRFERFGTAGNASQDQGHADGRDGQALSQRRKLDPQIATAQAA